jgi:hypothetical protein
VPQSGPSLTVSASLSEYSEQNTVTHSDTDPEPVTEGVGVTASSVGTRDYDCFSIIISEFLIIVEYWRLSDHDHGSAADSESESSDRPTLRGSEARSLSVTRSLRLPRPSESRRRPGRRQPGASPPRRADGRSAS